MIETDTFGDLMFSGERPRTLKAFDTQGIVMQCCSLAHYVAPGFNLGWMNAGRWRAEVERLKGLTNVAGAALPQLAMAEFLESGAFDAHLKRLRAALARSVDVARQEVVRLFPAGTRVNRPEGGFVLWIQLPDGYDGTDVQRRAAAAGIHILPGCGVLAERPVRDLHPDRVRPPGRRHEARRGTIAEVLGKIGRG